MVVSHRESSISSNIRAIIEQLNLNPVERRRLIERHDEIDNCRILVNPDKTARVSIGVYGIRNVVSTNNNISSNKNACNRSNSVKNNNSKGEEKCVARDCTVTRKSSSNGFDKICRAPVPRQRQRVPVLKKNEVDEVKNEVVIIEEVKNLF